MDATERPRVVIGSDVDEAGIAREIVDAVGIRPRHHGTGEIMHLHAMGRLRAAPLTPRVLVVPQELLLLRIHRDDRPSGDQRLAHFLVDEPKLRIPIRVIGAFRRFARRLQAKAHAAQHLRDRLVTDRVPGGGQLGR